MSLLITCLREVVPHKVFTFPGGEVGVKISWGTFHATVKITARIHSSADLVELLMVTDALRRLGAHTIELFMPYIPYGRQDRVCVRGEAFSLKVFADIINAQKYDKLVTLDPHSDVTAALLDGAIIHDQKTVIGKFDALNARIINSTNFVLVSPDAGANKKTADLAAHYGHETFLRADKLRELSTGKIKEIVVVNPREEVEGRQCLIVDDLCDAGGTFVGLAKALKAKGAGRVELYTTHGIYSKGLQPLHDGGVDQVWSTTAYRTDLLDWMAPAHTVLDIDEVF